MTKLCLRFTLALGKDIGGYDATGSGGSEGSLSSYCGLWIDGGFIQLEHDYELIQRVEPTDDEDGFIEYRCSKCHDIYREVLPAGSPGKAHSFFRIRLCRKSASVLRTHQKIPV